MEVNAFGVLVRSISGFNSYSHQLDPSAQRHIASMFERTDQALKGSPQALKNYDSRLPSEGPFQLDRSDERVRLLIDACAVTPLVEADASIMDDPNERTRAYFCTVKDGPAVRTGIIRASAFKSFRSDSRVTFDDGRLAIERRMISTLGDRWDLVIEAGEVAVLEAVALSEITGYWRVNRIPVPHERPVKSVPYNDQASMTIWESAGS